MEFITTIGKKFQVEFHELLTMRLSGMHKKFFEIWWRDGDSNPRNCFAVYTISSRAPSASRTPLQIKICQFLAQNGNIFKTKAKIIKINFYTTNYKFSKAKKHRFFCNIAGDPDGIRTRVTAVKGRCLNLLTTGPATLSIIRIKKKMSRDSRTFLHKNNPKS